MNEPNIVVTMTSWAKRLPFLGKSIYKFMTTQTVKPDIFYLWLSLEEFPNKEKDLPDDLLMICESFNIQIKWCEFNDICFKRWYVYPEHYNDMVFSIDDDVEFPANLIEEGKKHICETNTVYNIFQDLTFEYYPTPNCRAYFPNRDSLLANFAGMSCVCPKTFPLETLTEENVKARRKVCKRCDETWIKGFSIMNGTMTRRLPFIYKNQKEYDFSEQTACHNTLLKRIDGHCVIEYQIYYCLKCYPEHYKKWLELFPNYKPVYEMFDKMDFEKVKKIVEEQ